MWTSVFEAKAQGRVEQLRFEHEGEWLTAIGFYEQLASSEPFRAQFNALLAEVPSRVIRWETPQLTKATATDNFECVIVDSPNLDRAANQSAFVEQFALGGADGIAVFDNLGGDATLVVPCPAGPDSAYCHLSAFVRGAPANQQHALWRRLAEAVLDRLSGVPVWVNTAGGGVPWLHLRLDSRPKYYQYSPYKEM